MIVIYLFNNNWYLQLVDILCKFQVFQKGILHLHNQFFLCYSLILFQIVLEPLCIFFNYLLIGKSFVSIWSVYFQYIFCIWYFELFTFVFMCTTSVYFSIFSGYYPYLKPWAVCINFTSVYFGIFSGYFRYMILHLYVLFLLCAILLF